MNARRLPNGGLIDRNRPLRFRFDGRTLDGFAGDSLASALLANGMRVVGRSFKYHRPRGIYAAGDEEPCALVEIGEGASRVPNCRATTVALSEGLVARSQGGWPALAFDLGRVVDLTHGLWPAGFYNKTFKWPGWHTWEPLIRRSTGRARSPDARDPDRYEQVNAHCDLLVCGAGPHGLLAAQIAARSGLRVILCDPDRRFGGQLQGERLQFDGADAWRWADRVASELRGLPNVLLLPRTTATGVYDGNLTTLLQAGQSLHWRECLWTVRPRHLLLATGAIEQGLIFPHNDRPGVMLAGAVRQYVNRYAVAPGRNVVVATNNDSAYQAAFDLAERGIAVQTVADSRPAVRDDLRQRLSALGIEMLTGARVGGTRGAKVLRDVRLETLDGKDLGRRRCDLLAVSGGWAPRVHLLAHARGTLRFDEATQAFVPERLPQGVSVVGSASGIGALAGQLARTIDAARDLCSALGAGPVTGAAAVEAPQVTAPVVEAETVAPLQLDTARPRQWIDLAHDVTLGDAALAVREGYVAAEHFKRYTTAGMAADQGKTGNLNAFIVLGALTGRSPGEVGVTTFRPPYVPVTLGAIAAQSTGESYAPRRYLPAHTAHQRLGALFGDYGWQRPDCYPRAGESPHDAIRREVQAVRNGVGIYDNSPIGKLEVRGPDAGEFLDRLYVNNVRSLAPGRARYGLMLNDNGVIIDDGVFVRWADDHYLVHTTSAGVQRIGAMMEEWLQCEWRDLRVLVDDQTTQWACFTLAGPRAREVLQALGTDIDLCAAALPHMAATQGAVAGQPARVARVSFSGECSFEVSVPAARAAAFWDAALEAGQPRGIAAYGIEALMVLRLEKGYLHVGTDTDGSSTPDDVGWGEVARRKATDFIGRRSLTRSGNLDESRKQLVGLQTLDPGQAMRPGAHLLIGADRRPPAPTDGWITSAAFSPTLGRHVALGLVSGGRWRLGETLTACDEAHRYHVKIVSPVSYDPEHQQLRI